MRDPAVRAVMSLISVREDASAGDLSGGMEGRYADVTVRTADGREARVRVDDARGSWTRPLLASEVDEKFLACASDVWGAVAARTALAALRDPSQGARERWVPSDA